MISRLGQGRYVWVLWVHFMQCYFQGPGDKSNFLEIWDDFFYVPHAITRTLCEPHKTIKNEVKMYSLPLLFPACISSHCWIRNCYDRKFLFFLKHVLSFVKQRGILIVPMLDIFENDKQLCIFFHIFKTSWNSV